MDKTEPGIGRCGRVRSDGTRCDRRLVGFIEIGDGRWRIRARRGTEAQANNATIPHEIARLFSVAERWSIPCHPRLCGARYELLAPHLEELLSLGRDFYLADAVQVRRAS